MSVALCAALQQPSRPPLAAVAAAVALLGWLPGPARAQGAEAATQAASSSSRVIDLDVRINNRALGTWPVLDLGGYYHVAVPDLEIWRLRQRPEVPLVQERGKSWYPLAAIRGSELRHAISDARLELQVPASALLPGSLPALAPAPAVPAAPASARAAAAPPAAAAAAAAAPTPRQPAGSPAQRFLPMEVTVNGGRAGNWVLLEDQGVLYAPSDAFDEWRVTRSPQARPLDVRGQRWYALASVPGFESRIQFANQSIDLLFSPQAFAATKLTQEVQKRPELTPSIPAAFVNYDFNYSTQRVDGTASTRDLGALLELGFSNDFGVLTSTYSGTGLLDRDPQVAGGWRRLETTFSRDFPTENLTLRIGDSSTRAGIGGRSVYFGGLQIGTNFGLTPGFLTQPVPVLSGMSSAPSTVELYVNDALRQTSRVPTGPFAIDNFPLLTGSGQARIVVRDLLGRETVLVQDFFTHSSLLEKGLSDWSVQVGAVRQNLGTRNSDYGQRFGSGLYRHGLSQSTTLEARAEAGQDTRGLGLAVSQAFAGQVLGAFSVAASNDRSAGSGHHLSAGLEHQKLRHGFTARVETASIDYRQLGQDATVLPTRMQVAASYNYAHPSLGNWGVGMARIDSHTAAPLTTYSMNYSTRLGQRGSLAFTLTRVSGPSSGTAAGVSLLIPLDGALTSSSSATWRDGKLEAYTSVNKGLTAETGTGYRALAGTRQGGAFSEGGFYLQGGQGMVSADISASGDQQALRLGARGGLAMADGRFMAARRIESSFAVVEVPGYANVGVGFQGSSLTRTDASGVAILPRLNAYSINSIRLDPRELPINAEIDNIEQIAVPAARSAVKVVFPVRSGRGALIRLLLDDGEPAPAGAEVELVGDKKEFFVARRGEAFITGLQERNTIRLKFNGQSCTVQVVLPPAAADEIARIGPLACTGVKR